MGTYKSNRWKIVFFVVMVSSRYTVYTSRYTEECTWGYVVNVFRDKEHFNTWRELGLFLSEDVLFQKRSKRRVGEGNLKGIITVERLLTLILL